MANKYERIKRLERDNGAIKTLLKTIVKDIQAIKKVLKEAYILSLDA